ncbi:MAG TPA: YqgE/AlgH family protein [Terriglobales bacterium]|nr:YqgE/AlgH family protein [Terriglobales bacterium]
MVRLRLALGMLLCSLAALGAAQAPAAKPAAGTLLVATARVTSGRFHQAVVLLVTDSDKGAAGLVINQPGNTPLPRLFPHLASAQSRTDVAFEGGPVGAKVLFCLLHMQGRLREARALLPEVYFSTSRALMELAFNAQQPAASFRVFQGYTGWTPGQLSRELAAGLWTVAPATAAIVFDPDPATLWTRLTTAASVQAFAARRQSRSAKR